MEPERTQEATARRFVPAPGYTQVPNVLFDDYVLECSGSEWKVLSMIARHTFGWQVEERLLTTGQLAELTGLSRQAVSGALTGLIGKGMISRRHHKSNQWQYGIPVKKLDTVKKLGSPEMRQPSDEIEGGTTTRGISRDGASLKERERSPAHRKKPDKAAKKSGAPFSPDPNDPADAVIVELFELWRDRTDQPANAHLTEKRASLVRARLREQARGLPPETALAEARAAMVEALEGWFGSSWHRERKAFDFETLFRSYDKVEMFRGRRREQLANGHNSAPDRFAEYDAEVERQQREVSHAGS